MTTTDRTGPDFTGAASDTVCVLPWMHLAMTVDGIWARCCYDADARSGYHRQGGELRLSLELGEQTVGCMRSSVYAGHNPDKVMSLSEAFNAEPMRRTRLDMLAGRVPSSCSHCFGQEKNGLTSRRLRRNAELCSMEELDRRLALTTDRGELPYFPPFLDVRLGNRCSLRCVMCAYPASSSHSPTNATGDRAAEMSPCAEDESFWADIRAHAGDVRMMYVSGGEPFIHPSHHRLLDTLIESGEAGRIRLHYSSSLMALPHGLFERWARFAHVRVAASCDGTGHEFERIRVGATWDTFCRNMTTVRSHADVTLEVSPQRDNIHQMRDLVVFSVAQRVPIRVENYVTYPARLSVRSLPTPERELCAKELLELAREFRHDAPDTARQLVGLARYVSA